MPWLFACKRAYCHYSARRVIWQPQCRDELRVEDVQEPGRRGARPFRDCRPPGVSLPHCDGRPRAHDAEQHDGDARMLSLTCGPPRLDSADAWGFRLGYPFSNPG